MIFVPWLLLLLITVAALIQVARIPDYQFRAAKSNKLAWILIVILANPVGSWIWFLYKRRKIVAARGLVPPPPPGWYSEAATGGLRWWDGEQWSDIRHAVPARRNGQPPDGAR